MAGETRAGVPSSTHLPWLNLGRDYSCRSAESAYAVMRYDRDQDDDPLLAVERYS